MSGAEIVMQQLDNGILHFAPCSLTCLSKPARSKALIVSHDEGVVTCRQYVFIHGLLHPVAVVIRATMMAIAFAVLDVLSMRTESTFATRTVL